MESPVRVVRRLFPNLAIKQIVKIELGWMSRVLVVNGKYVVKVPRNREIVDAIAREIKIISAVRKYLPVRIPNYVAYNLDSEEPAAAYEFIEGTLLSVQSLDSPLPEVEPLNLDSNEIESLKDQIAEIMNSIHGIDPVLLQSNSIQPYAFSWKTNLREKLKSCESVSRKYFSGNLLSACLHRFDKIPEQLSGMCYATRFIHGDFGGWNLLYDRVRGKVAGVLDWEDSRIDDPASDFSDLIFDFGSSFVSDVLRVYRHNGDHTILQRARIYAFINSFRDYDFGIEHGSVMTSKRALEYIENFLGEDSDWD